MPADQRPDELDRLIEGGRDADSLTFGDPAAEALADVAAELEALAGQAAIPHADAVWSRVEAGIEASELKQARSRFDRWRERQVVPRAVWGLSVAASVALIALLFALLSEPTSTSAAFLRDVDQLSDCAGRCC